MTDLNEKSLFDLMMLIRSDPSLTACPRQLIITEEGLAHCRDLAARDPEFVRRVREEFPDLADSLLGT